MSHVLTNDLRASVLNAAIQGKLSQQLKVDSLVDKFLITLKNEKEKPAKSKKKVNENNDLMSVTKDVPFEIPDGWRWVTLQFISKKIYAGGDKPKVFSKEPTVDNIYPVVANSKENNGILGYSNDFNAVEGTITMAARGSNVGLTTYRSYKYLPIVRLIVIELVEGVNPRYLQIVLSSIGQANTGSAIPQITVPMLINKLIPLPPIEEQQRIVDRVEELMAKIDEYEKLENKLVQLKKGFPGDMKAAILQAAMQGQLTNHECNDSNIFDYLVEISKKKNELLKNKAIKKDKTTLIKEGDEMPFDIPNYWSWVKLGQLAELSIGKTPPRAEPIWWGKESDIPWISVADMVSNGITLKTKEFISKKCFDNKFKSRISSKGTLIMSFKLTVGRVSILGMDALHNEAIISIKPFIDSDGILRNYLFKVLPYIVKYGDSKNAIKGETLNSDSLCNLLVPLPPVEEQERIVEILDKLLPLCDGLACGK